jgi:peptidoglycan lytic transglycosylase G
MARRNGGQKRIPARGPRPAARWPRRTTALVALAVLCVAVLWFLASLFQPFHGDGSGRVAVTIPRSASAGQIADLLEQKGVVSSSFFFQLRATLGGKRDEFKSGSYALKKDMSYGAAMDALTKTPAAADVVSLVIPEGKSRREIAPSIKSLRGDYLAATKRSPLLNPARYGGRGARDLEGFLFPATYQLKRGQDVKALVAKQLTTFKQRFATVNLRAAKKVNLTPYDVLIIGSLVERETAIPAERGLVASVIYNRLHQGTPLGIDATTRFQYNDWVHSIRESWLESPSRYNTRTHDGLPPGPIGSPGIASIKAAANPPKTKYLYYVQDCNRPDHHVFARTQAQFDAAFARYNRARAQAGGNAPKHC